MSSRKRNINGSIRPRPSAEDVRYYDLTLELGTDPISGKRKRIYFKADTTDRQEAENMLVIKKAEYLQGEIIEPSEENSWTVLGGIYERLCQST